MTTKNNITINKWYDYNFPISNQILLPTHIEFAVKKSLSRYFRPNRYR